MASLIVAAVLAVFVMIVIGRSVRIVPQAREGIVERLGRYSRTLKPGLHVLIPFLDRLKPLVDMREQVVNFPPQPVITEDNVTISIDTVLYFRVEDPVRASYAVANLIMAIEQLVTTTLRNVIGSLSLEETLTSRDKINQELRIVLDDATGPWGIRVSRIELKSIDPPSSIQEAMEKQMRAERDKRAAILQAEGAKASAILNAEGDRQAQILRAEAQQQAQILEAEGDRQARVLRAAGEAEAVRSVFAAIHEGDPSPDLLAYKYLETLPQVANGQATKLVMVPSDAIGGLGSAASFGAAFEAGRSTAEDGADERSRTGTNGRTPAA
jgi:regulator of protease activity HflC (stomatin/prohibitin superfamily)